MKDTADTLQLKQCWKNAILILSGTFSLGLHATPQEEMPCAFSNTEPELYACLKQHIEQADTVLNQTYQLLITRYQSDPSTQTQAHHLQKAQRTWIQLRDESCNFETYESITGSGFGSIYTQCLLEKTQERVKYLKWYLENP